MRLSALRRSAGLAACAVGIGFALLVPTLSFDGAEPAAAQGTAARKPVSACTLSISDTLVTSPMSECGSAGVTVTLGVTCPTELPMRVVFVIGRHLLMEDHLDQVKNAARGIANSMPFHVAGTKAGVVSVSIQERVEQEMTASKSSVMGSIGAIRLDRVDPTTRYFDWLGKAQDMLEEARRNEPLPAVEAIVLFSTGCPTGFDSFCNRQVGAANRAKGADITVIGVCHPDAMPFGLIPIPGDHCKYIRNIATTGRYHDLNRAKRAENDLAELMSDVGTLQPGAVTLAERLAPGFTLIPESGAPAPRTVDGVHIFSWPDVERGDVLAATYRISATMPGLQPLRETDASAVGIMDSMGRAVEIPLTSPDVVVEPCPTGSPTAPPSDTSAPTSIDMPESTSTPTPSATSTLESPNTPTPSATPKPGRIWLPVALKNTCKAGARTLLVALAIDTSSSMDEASGGTTKLAAAKAAAKAFVDVLAASGRGDLAGVVAFDARARIVVDVGADHSALHAGIDSVRTGEGTRIDAGLETSAAMLSRALLASPDALPVVVLLTDGRPDVGTADAALRAAEEGRASGLTIYTIGLGDDVDADFLRAIATTPGHFLAAPDADALESIYDDLARDLPCPGGVVSAGWAESRPAASSASVSAAHSARSSVSARRRGSMPADPSASAESAGAMSRPAAMLLRSCLRF